MFDKELADIQVTCDKIYSQCETIFAQGKAIAEQNQIIIEQNKITVDYIKVVSDLVRATLEFQKNLATEIVQTQTMAAAGLMRLGAGDLTEYLKPKKGDKPDGGKQSEVPRDNEDEAGEGKTTEM